MNSIGTLDYSLSPNQQSALPAQLSVHFMGRTLRIHAEQISFLEGDGNYTYVYTCAGRKYLICKTLKWLACKLDTNFIRVHKSFLVNADYVIGCAEDGRVLKMRCGNEAVVSRRKTKEIIGIFGERMQRISA
ncbi:LytR/AlgR family response regulator transcription factor [Dyadobacter jiangsuensis]|uniref:LytTr DNA-binding domain-containing protein n=1 Tax=Dyadobacter jiangsuensis TaxID=1591085 RepID=A0A2P8FNA3_9BACT|nr:LytTR family DNA-binding domain-containing protein [Dyadobacter jiangsuensis]PSL23204.1 LytTr DNA-binding domain-containing protein [Dyadobacter jiangsuensis]